MIRFTSYYGHEVWISPTRVLYVEDGGCGSRGVSTIVHLDGGEIVTLNDNADRVQSEIGKALAA